MPLVLIFPPFELLVVCAAYYFIDLNILYWIMALVCRTRMPRADPDVEVKQDHFKIFGGIISSSLICMFVICIHKFPCLFLVLLEELWWEIKPVVVMTTLTGC